MTNMNAREQVDRLVALISQAAHDALDEYEKHGTHAPTLDSLTPHPLDSEVNTIHFKKIIRKLEGACEQLCTTLAPPQHTIVNRAQDSYWAALRVAAKVKLADALAEEPNGLHTSVLAKKLQIEQGKLTSILRLLSSRHCFSEVDVDVFANNRLSILLHSSQSLSSFVDLLTKDPQNAALHLQRSLSEQDYATSNDPQKSAFMYAVKDLGIKGTVYDVLRSDPEKRAIMGKAMIAMNSVLGSLSFVYVYPWQHYRTICDVGSGVGSFAWALLEHHPSLHIVLHDLPETIEIAKEVWNKNYTNLVQSEKIAFLGGSFFEEVPAKNVDIYYLRNIMHNWPDAQAANILQNVRKAMGPHSHVLIHEYVMQPLCASHSENGLDKLTQAEAPLLPSYGAGQLRLYNQDMTMMLLYNARERTIHEMEGLAGKADLKLQKVWDLGETSVLEFVAA